MAETYCGKSCAYCTYKESLGGALVLLAASIGIIVVGILQLVYLYRTAKLFRQVTAR